MLSAALPLSFGNSKHGGEGRVMVTTALGRISQVGFAIYCLRNAGPPQNIRSFKHIATGSLRHPVSLRNVKSNQPIKTLSKGPPTISKKPPN